MASENDFYNIPTGDIDPAAREGYDSEGVESAYSDIETKAAPILTAISNGKVPIQEEDRFWLSFFVAAQLTRGWQHREMVKEIGIATSRQHFDPRNSPLRERVKDYLKYLNEPNSLEEVTRFIERCREAAENIVPDKSHLIQDSLRHAWSPVGPELLSRPLRVFRFKNPSLLTSDAAIGLWAPDSDGPRSVGVGNARGIFLAIDRYTAIGFMSGGKSRDIAGDPFWAKHINLSIADRATKWIYHHPNDDPLSEIALPPRYKL